MRYMIFLVLSGCASTTVYHPNGKPAFHTQADIAELSYKNGELTARLINHSLPTRAGGSVIGTTMAGALPIVTAAKGFIVP